MRSYRINEEGTLVELDKMKMINPYWLLCDPQRGILLVGEISITKSESIVRLARVLEGGGNLEFDPTPIRAFDGRDVKCLCIKNEESIFCFDMNKSEIVEFAFK